MKKFYFNDEPLCEETFNSMLEEKANDHVAERYDDNLDDDYGYFHMGDLVFSASQILKTCDPIAYRCGLGDYQSWYLGDSQYELEHTGETSIGNDTFRIEEVL